MQYAPRNTTIIQTWLSFKCDHKALLQIRRRLSHDLRIRILEDVISSHFNVHVATGWAHCRLRAEVDELPSEVAFVLGYVGIEARGKTWVVPSRRLRIVVNKVDSRRRRQAHLPTRR